MSAGFYCKTSLTTLVKCHVREVLNLIRVFVAIIGIDKSEACNVCSCICNVTNPNICKCDKLHCSVQMHVIHETNIFLACDRIQPLTIFLLLGY